VKKEVIELKMGELFSGPGGLALGAQNAKVETDTKMYKIKHEWANDFHEDSCKTYRRNIDINPKNVICEDVRKLNIEKLSPIDVFAYGFPCNDFSNVGKRKGFEGEYGPLYTYGVKILNKFNPLFFVAENVSGLKSANSGKAFAKILEDLENSGMGYNLTVHEFKAEEYGIPQKRHRIIIVGFRKDLNKIFKVPAPTHKNKYISVKEVLENITPDAPNHEFTRQSKIVVERLKRIKPGQNIWDVNDSLPPELRLNVKGAKLSQIYKRLHPDEPSYTVTGSGGGGTHIYHYKEPRALTNRERARLQSFPDNFIFEGNKESVRRQIGMAVPPKLAEIIFTACLKTLVDIEYPFIEPSLESCRPLLF